MKDELVQLKTAMLAERLGFGKAYNRYLKTPTATQTSVSRWLREKKNYHVSVYRNASGYGWEICKADNGTHILNDLCAGYNDGGLWDTHEEALEAGMLEALSICK